VTRACLSAASGRALNDAAIHQPVGGDGLVDLRAVTWAKVSLPSRSSVDLGWTENVTGADLAAGDLPRSVSAVGLRRAIHRGAAVAEL